MDSYDELVRQLRKVPFNDARVAFNKIQNELGFPFKGEPVEFLEFREKRMSGLLLERTGWTYTEYVHKCLENLNRELERIRDTDTVFP